MPALALTPPLGEIDMPSVRQQLVALAPGESYATAKRIDQNEATRDMLISLNDSMRDGLAAATARAKRETGSEYVIANGEFLTGRGKDVVLVVIVTRMN